MSSKKIIGLSFVAFFALCLTNAPLLQLNAIGDEIEVTPVPDGFTRYEAEDSIVTDGEIKGKMPGALADYGTYSGDGFVGCLDYPTSKLEFVVNVDQDGNYPFNVSYAIDSAFGSATFNVFVNNNYYSSISLVSKKGWGSFTETPDLESSINLYEGENHITLVKGYNHAEIDYIDIGPRNGEFIDPSIASSEISKIPTGYTRYEAEKGKISGGKIYNTGTYSGTGYVGDLDYAGISKIDFEVTATEDGEYNLHLAYAIGEGFKPATFKVFNDSGLYTTLKCDNQFGWGSFELESITEGTISLKEGTNIVSIYKSNEYAQIDFIDIGKNKIGEYKDSALALEYPNYDPDNYKRYEAEDQLVILGSPKGIAFISDFGTYSGRGYVGSMDNDYCYVEIPIKVDEDGEYEIKVAYACAEAHASLKLYTGKYGRGGNVYFDKEITFENYSDWGEFTADTIFTTTINLKASDDFIIIKSGLIRAEIDYIDFGKKIGEYNQGVLADEFNRHNPKGEE